MTDTRPPDKPMLYCNHETMAVDEERVENYGDVKVTYTTTECEKCGHTRTRITDEEEL